MKQTLFNIAAEQGWTDGTTLSVMIDFVYDKHMSASLMEYVKSRTNDQTHYPPSSLIRHTVQSIADLEGWTESTVFGIVMDFIESKELISEVSAYAQLRANEENDEEIA